MPELPEVQKAANRFKALGIGKVIQRIETTEDTIVYAGTTHTEFAQELQGRTIKNVGRYGKLFFLELEGPGRMPVFHFGMTGMLQVRGEPPTYYKGPPSNVIAWPPRFMKFIMHLSDPNSSSVSEIAFMDARRLGRIRLCTSPLKELPISGLGFDPILCMPSLDDFSAMVIKRSCPIKALLLDQSFSAGVGNWVADEILYNARVHPEQRCNSLTAEQISAIHHNTSHICLTAVAVDADDTKFPDHWIFKHRWGKGKKTKHSMKLPSGDPATIEWVTVGGRTSAYVAELQKYAGPPPSLSKRKSQKRTLRDEEEKDSGSGRSEESSKRKRASSGLEPLVSPIKRKSPRKLAAKKR